MSEQSEECAISGTMYVAMTSTGYLVEQMNWKERSSFYNGIIERVLIASKNCKIGSIS